MWPERTPVVSARVGAMPLKFFLKLYARLAGVTALVVLLCVALFAGINSVRLQYWQERFPEPLMRWLAAAPAPAEQYHWLGAVLELREGSAAQFDLSPVVAERLGYGQVVSLESNVGLRLLVAGVSGDILELRLADPYRDIARATGLILRWHLDSVPPPGRVEVAGQMAEALNVDIQSVGDDRLLPDSEVLAQVAERGLAFYREGQSGRGRVMIQLADGELFRIDMPAPFNPWAWPLLLLVALVLGGVLAIALFLALREVDSNLRAVESVAVRIARGEMGARVEAGESRLVTRLAVSFNGMAEHIQRLVQVQREMIHAVSHELRTPVARIRFGVQMIEDCQDQEALQKQLDGIDGDIQELDELIDEILTYARLEQGGPVFSLQETSVTDIVRQVVSEQQLVRPELTIEGLVDPESERWSMSDIEPRYIHRAIQNLVGNAGRYAAGKVRVTCHCDEDNCRIDVEDDGPGIPEADWEKVFTAFARLDDSRTRTSGGYGLGLSIVRRILYWHGGHAFVGRSDTLGGARFSLVWPRKKPLEAVL
ncbi:two-component system, OmpR family, sensor histidine kinase RstB [Marinobacter gudaonensis]|uniref:histidine kinase n=1 Tax=Marinobacter gudaonensis TaxID=375760 RepID=A0A1I6HNN2_9GAMM|nr:ATP-binding protein [Marinobacter gudaonensis]SFR55947.1 two-component system, OmpR family, sensor histidine kinase RstB [Marinobacter gudaonensis]